MPILIGLCWSISLKRNHRPDHAIAQLHVAARAEERRAAASRFEDRVGDCAGWWNRGRTTPTRTRALQRHSEAKRSAHYCAVRSMEA